MSQQLYEVAFSGQISKGANAAEVRARVGKMFNADEAKLKQLFSGKRIVIKKNIDEATAAKYQAALDRAGAISEVKPMGGAAAPASPAAKPAQPAALRPVSPAAERPAAAAGEADEAGSPPQTDPLGITGDQIEDLAVSLAPVGSAMQDEYASPETPQFDLSGLDIAPVGADLGARDRSADPPPPDTGDLKLEG